MGEVLENGVYLPDEGERNAYNGLKGNWNTVDTVVAQVQALSSTGLIRKPVDELPTEDIETNVIYMLKAEKPNGDVYRIEYMYIDNHWDALGTSETTLEDYYTKTETDDLPAVKSGINATRVSNYDAHLANNDVHVTLANKQSWDGKQAALDANQTAAVNSGVNAAKVTGYDTHVSDTDIHVTTSDKTAWNGKQDGLSQTQLAAVNSGITEAKRTGYDSHVADTDVHVTTADKAAWNGKQNALTQTQLDNIAAVPDKANSADLATVATTGDYGDLLNAPTIPTVNNASLTIQKNGTDVATFTANASSNVTANLAIPTKTSELDNDAGFLTQHNPIDNELSATSENALQNKVVKSELDGKAPLVHTHAASDVTSGTFNIARIPNLDASKITSGTIDIARLPKGALERLVKVANQAARYALTTDDVQLGDTVQQLDTGVMYVVTDETKLDSADGYTEFTAGAASSVPWTGVTGKPNDYPPSSHTHTKSQITDFPAYGTTAGTICEGNDSRLSDARTPVAHTHTKSDVTDLFNSANTWTGDNSFSKTLNIYNSDSSDTAPALYLKSSKSVIGTMSASETDSQKIAVLDKNGNTVSENTTYVYSTGGGSSWTVNAVYTTDSSNNVISSQISHYILKNGLRVLRSDTNTDLGTSVSLWRYVYAQAYFSKSSAPIYFLKNTELKKGVLPAAASFANSSVWHDKNDAVLGYSRFVVYTNGTQTYEVDIRNTVSNGALDPEGSLQQVGFQLENNPALSIGNFKVYANLQPSTDNTYRLGDSTRRWKSLNGINPGALSLPGSSYDPISTQNWVKRPSSSDGGFMCNIVPSVNGWICIQVSREKDFGVWVVGTFRQSFRAVQTSPSTYVNMLFFPALAGSSINIYTNFVETDDADLTFNIARIYPCLGNV